MKSSREGKRFYLATFLIVIAALNTGNNLIYLILAMMLSIFLLSILILKINMSGLVLKVFQREHIFANNPSNLEITLTNNKRGISSYSINISIPGKSIERLYFEEISPHGEMTKPAPVIYKKRGLYGYGKFFIESSFPFIFLKRKITCRVEDSVLVYPEIRNVDAIIPDLIFDKYDSLISGSRKGDEFSMIREFRYGDDWRRIHWKASAKTAQFMTKEYTAEEPKKATIILDNLLPEDESSFEKSVSLAASLSARFLKEEFFVRLVTCKKLIPFGNGRDHFFKILDVLALIKAQDSYECPLSAQTEPEGLILLILNSRQSPLNKFIPISNRVVYATTL